MTNYQEFVHQIAKLNINLEFKPPQKKLPLKKIESIIQKPLPQELFDFYSFCDGFEGIWQSQNQSLIVADEHIPSLEEMFGDYKKPKKISKSMYLKDEIYKLYDNPFWEQIWDDNFLNIGKCDPDTPEGLTFFNFLMNLKPLMFLNGDSKNLVIDFFDSQKDYQIYYQDYTDLYPLHLDFQTFYKILFQIGTTAHWFIAFFDEHNKPTWDTTVEYTYIQEHFPDFDIDILKNKKRL